MEAIVRKSGYSFAKIAKKLGISRNTLYNRFQDADVSWQLITKLGKSIHYDFTLDFPELKAGSDLLGLGLTHRIEGKYMRLLEKYNRILELMIRLAEQNEALDIRRQIDALIDTDAQGEDRIA